MRLMAFGGIGVFALGAYAMAGGSDAERVIAKSPSRVYEAFSDAVGPSGSSEQSLSSGSAGTVVTTVTKTRNEAIDLVAMRDHEQVLHLSVHFAPAEGGKATRVSADADVDPELLAGVSGVSSGYVVRRTARYAMQRMLDNAAADIEGGRAIASINMREMRSDARRGAGERVADAHLREAGELRARPMQNNAPMVDPNAAARAYMRKSDWN